MKEYRCGPLGLMLCMVFLGIWLQVTPALAEWGGPPGTGLFGSAGAACAADKVFRGPNAIYTGMYVGGYHPVTGNIATYICFFPITFNLFGAQFRDPTPAVCPAEKAQQGWVVNGSDPRGCVPPDPPKKENGKPCCPKKECCRNEGKPAAGNPISVASGNKYEEVVDFATAGPNQLAFIRSYNRFSGRAKTQFGIGWRSNFDRSLHMPSTVTTIAVRPDSQELTFTKSGGTWHSDTDISAQLSTNGTTWTFIDADDTQEVYDLAGKLLMVTQHNGYQQTVSYNTDDQVATVLDAFGRQLTFTYSHGTLATMTTPDGHSYTYHYDKTIPDLLDPNRLVSVTYPDETPDDPTDNPSLTYLYEDPLYDHALTGIRDEKGIRLATYAYDTEGRAIMSEHANGAGRVEVAYHSDGTRTVTEASGQQFVYHFASIQGARKVTQVDRLATSTVPAATSTSTYDTNGYLASRTDWKGNLTTYVRDSRGLELSRTEAAGTPQARTTSTTWHATYHLPTQIVEPNRTTAITYSQGLVLTRTETDTTGGPSNGQTQAWAYTYTTAGQVATVNGPRTNVSDVTTYTYTPEGYLKTTTNALGQVTQVLTHTLQGLPALLRDPNGVETELAYHPRGWLLRMTVKSAQGDATTQFTYDDAGQVTRITRPDGSVLHYDYDQAHRVVAVRNALSERIDYALDAAGNRLSETVKSTTGTITRMQTRTFDSLARLLTQVGGVNQTTTYAYDANGNRTGITDPLQQSTQQVFDPLNRLVSVTDPASHTATYGYNAQDHLTTVTDQRALTTTYTYNAFGDVIQQTSPDTGTTTYQVDSAGNRTQETDARGIVTTYTYDALNRVTTRAFPASQGENVTYSYDATAGGNQGVGRLTGITDQSGSTSFVYDDRGNVVTDTRLIGTQTAHTSYTYDLADHLVQVTYPSGRRVIYHRDAQGRVASVTTQASGVSVPSVVASAITYHPFGPMASLTYGNGLVLSLSYDQDYRLTGLQTAAGGTVVQNLSYTYNAIDNLTTLTDLLTPARTQTLGYDVLNRLTGATGVYGSLGFTLDGVGNRLTRTQGGSTESYTYDTASNRLLSTTQGSQSRSFTYLPNGQISTDTRTGPDVYSLTYAAQNRLAQVTHNGQATTDYVYNALGQRVIKDALTGGTDQHMVYDRQGRLLVETDGQGQPTKEYVYVDGLPLAVLDPGATGGGPALDLILDNGSPGVTSAGTWTATTSGSGYEGANYLEHPSGQLVVDNADTPFSTTGTWTSSTVGTGYVGTSYRTREATTASPLEVIVDNQDPGFSVVDTWSPNGSAEGYQVDFLTHSPQGLPAGALISDNTDAAFSASGTWTPSTAYSNYYGSNYLLHPKQTLPPSALIVTANGPYATWTGFWYTYSTIRWRYASSSTTDAFTWTLPVTEAKSYHVYARWNKYWNGPTNATYTIYHAGGSTVVVGNQQPAGGPDWHHLATVSLAPGQNHRVDLSAQSNGSVAADAIAVVAVEAPASAATWQPPITTAGDYGLYLKWPYYNQLDPAATYSIVHGEGTNNVLIDQRAITNPIPWVSLGLVPWAPNEDHRVELLPRLEYDVVADALAVAAAPIAATWTPTLPVPDTYTVSAWWAAASTNHPQATYHIYHAGGTSRVTINQTQNGGQWHVLGTYVMMPGQQHRVVLANQVGGTVVADAIKFQAAGSGTPRTATWGLSVPATGTYDVYVRWAADAVNATNASYTGHYAGGTTVVPMNQTQNGGQWNLLGTFTLNPASNPMVELSDQANGRVVADAVMVVPSGVSTDHVTYTPTLTSSETVDIYAKWTESATRAQAVTYTVQHAGGATDIVVNQQQPSAGWFRLGAFAMSPGQNHHVEVAGALEGVTVADAMRFVSAGVSAPGIHYVHADHLGSPQKMTDANQTIVWDAVYTPFGQVHSITGTATNNQRFPGQYADAETGYSYNYFRDYDPTTGRYVQSDPVGLDGGLNTYGYLAAHNPVNSTDLTGLSRDSYVPDSSSHGGSHIDRYNEHGQNLGRYNADGSPVKHKGKIPPKIPKSDLAKFAKAVAKLAKLSGPLGLACTLLSPDEVNANKLNLLEGHGVPIIGSSDLNP